MRRNVNSDLSVATFYCIRRVAITCFGIGSCKIFHAKVLIASFKALMIIFSFKKLCLIATVSNINITV